MTYRVSFAHVKLVTWGLWRPGGPTRHWAPTGTSCWSQKLWNILSRCQKEVFEHTLSFHPIAAFILALWRSQRPPRPYILFLVKWFLLTSGSTPDGPWRCPAPPGPSRGPQRSQGHFLFLSLKPYNMGVYGFLLTSGLMPDVSWRCLNPSRSPGHFVFLGSNHEKMEKTGCPGLPRPLERI